MRGPWESILDVSPADTQIILSPSAQIIPRGPDAIQFGLDASRCGIVEIAHAPEIARCLQRLWSPTPIDALITALVEVGCNAATAQCLLDELAEYGVTHPARPVSVLVVGYSRLTTHLTRLLRALGITVRVPLENESLAELLAHLPAERPLILVDQFGWTPRSAALVQSASAPTIYVTGLDSRGLIGPVCLGGDGPCPMCVELHWVRQDPAFLNVARMSSLSRQDPVSVAATSASAASVIQSVLGMRPGMYEPLRSGDCLVVDPHAPERALRLTLSVNAGCPVCFESGALDRLAA